MHEGTKLELSQLVVAGARARVGWGAGLDGELRARAAPDNAHATREDLRARVALERGLDAFGEVHVRAVRHVQCCGRDCVQ